MSAGIATPPQSQPATAAPGGPAPELPASQADQVVVLRGVGWAGYEQLLQVRGDRGRPRIHYLDGDVYLMSPGNLHERDKDRFHMFLFVVTRALRMKFRSSGSTTYRKSDVEAGVEPDQSFYFESAARVAGKKDIDLDVDPPPDLSIEVVYSHAAKAAVEASRRLGIPEVWVSSERGLKFLVLGQNGRYTESPRSRAFPLLTAEEILHWVRRPETPDYSDLEWSDDLVAWVQATLLPRVTQHRP